MVLVGAFWRGGFSRGVLSGVIFGKGFLLWGFCLGGFCPPGGFVQGGIDREVLSGGFCPGGFCPRIDFPLQNFQHLLWCVTSRSHLEPRATKANEDTTMTRKTFVELQLEIYFLDKRRFHLF